MVTNMLLHDLIGLPYDIYEKISFPTKQANICDVYFKVYEKVTEGNQTDVKFHRTQIFVITIPMGQKQKMWWRKEDQHQEEAKYSLIIQHLQKE